MWMSLCLTQGLENKRTASIRFPSHGMRFDFQILSQTLLQWAWIESIRLALMWMKQQDIPFVHAVLTWASFFLVSVLELLSHFSQFLLALLFCDLYLKILYGPFKFLWWLWILCLFLVLPTASICFGWNIVRNSSRAICFPTCDLKSVVMIGVERTGKWYIIFYEDNHSLILWKY